jgi:hypothetical protein
VTTERQRCTYRIGAALASVVPGPLSQFPARREFWWTDYGLWNKEAGKNTRHAARASGGSMSELVTQAHRLINAASAAMAASTSEPPSPSTAMLARIVVSEAQKQRPNNLLLQSIALDGDSLDWDQIRAAMQVVVRTLDESVRSSP